MKTDKSDTIAIEMITDENTTCCCLGGRLDTTTAPELEEALKSLPESTRELVFDMKNLEYISSAGLRVFLSEHKKMSGKQRIVHDVCRKEDIQCIAQTDNVRL